MKPSIGFLLGIVAGCAGLLFAQFLFKSGGDPDTDAPSAEENLTLALERQNAKLDTANMRIKSLEEQIEAKSDPGAEGGVAFAIEMRE